MKVHTLPAYSLVYVYLPALFWVALGSMTTAPLGAKATHRMKTAMLRKVFAVLLLALALALATKLLNKMLA